MSAGGKGEESSVGEPVPVHFGWSQFEGPAPASMKKNKFSTLFSSFVTTLIKGKIKNKYCTYK